MVEVEVDKSLRTLDQASVIIYIPGGREVC